MRGGRGLGMDQLHQVLGVRPDASDEEIRAAFRRLAKQFHPDLRPGDGTAARRFQDVLSAYKTLKDGASRQAFQANLMRRKTRRAQVTTMLSVCALTVSLGLFWRDLSGALLSDREAPTHVSENTAPDRLALARTLEQSPAPEMSSSQLPALSTEPLAARSEATAEPERKAQGSDFDPGREAVEYRVLSPSAHSEGSESSDKAIDMLGASEIGVPLRLMPSVLGRAGNWVSYRDARFGFALEYPLDVFMQDRTQANEGQTSHFVSRDGRARLVVSAAPNMSGMTLAQYRRILMESSYKDAAFDYTPQRGAWFVLSGTQNADMFYERVTFSCDARAFHGWKLVYPVTERAFYDLIVEDVHRRYRHGNGPGRRCG